MFNTSIKKKILNKAACTQDLFISTELALIITTQFVFHNTPSFSEGNFVGYSEHSPVECNDEKNHSGFSAAQD